MKINNVLNIIYWVVFVILIISGSVVALSTLDSRFPYKFLSVQSGSMQPKIKLGSMVAVKSKSNYSIGDIITFKTNNNKNTLVTHRVVGIEKLENNQIQFITKGDANEKQDTDKVAINNVVGKVVSSFAYLGYLTSYIRKPFGTIVFIVVPATIFVVNEIFSIKKEITNIRKRKALL